MESDPLASVRIREGAAAARLKDRKERKAQLTKVGYFYGWIAFVVAVFLGLNAAALGPIMTLFVVVVLGVMALVLIIPEQTLQIFEMMKK